MGKSLDLDLASARKAGTRALRRLLGRVLPGGEENATAASSVNASDKQQGEPSSLQTGSCSPYPVKNNNTGPENGEIHSCNPPAQEVAMPTAAAAAAACFTAAAASSETQPPRLSLTSLSNSNSSVPEVPVPTTMSTSSSLKCEQNAHHIQEMDKENCPPDGTKPENLMAGLSLESREASARESDPNKPAPTSNRPSEDAGTQAERAKHMVFINDALDMARLALVTNETPVGCSLVHDGKVIARGMNATNVTRNGTRHAEFMALSALLSHPPANGPKTTCLKPKLDSVQLSNASDSSSVESRPLDEGNEDGRMGHLYPYGQKLHPDDQVDPAILRDATLYVTVEPCIMCASLLRQLGIKKVYFGAVNDKFGGTGGVFSIHANSLPIGDGGETMSAHPMPKPTQLPDGSGTLGVSFPPGGGDGGNIESGYEIEGGWGRDEAVALLRRFYVQENGRAPVPRKKEGRAARLAAMMENDGEGSPSLSALNLGDEKVGVVNQIPMLLEEENKENVESSFAGA